MTKTQKHLISQLASTLNPSFLEVVNESNKHIGHAGYDKDSHYKITVVSKVFNNLKLIDRHRLINKLFKEELSYIHAMQMSTYTPSEWDKK